MQPGKGAAGSQTRLETTVEVRRRSAADDRAQGQLEGIVLDRA